MNALDTIEYEDGHRIEVEYDQDAERPDSWDSGTTFQWGTHEQDGAVYLACFYQWEQIEEPCPGLRDTATILPDYAGCEAIGANPDTVAQECATDYINALNGNVYQWIAYDPEDSLIEAISGYYPDGLDTGPSDYMIQEARSAVERNQEKRRKEAEAVKYWEARDVRTVAA